MKISKEKVWAAAYGAAFASEALYFKRVLDGDAKLLAGRDAMEVACAIPCEMAMHLADEAVKKLEAWVADNGDWCEIKGLNP